MREKVYKTRIKDIDELHAGGQTAWNEMDQCIVDAAKAADGWTNRRVDI